jgi:hypothetical protein
MRQVLGSLIMLCASALAQGDSWGTQTTITGYYVYDSGAAFITTANNQDPVACGSSSYLYLDSTAPNFKSIWASVISAQATGSTVTLYYAGCYNGYPKVSAIAVPHMW